MRLSACTPDPRCGVFFFLIIRRPPRSPLFPYTTLFRSRRAARRPRGAAESDRLGGALPRGGVVAGPAPARAATDLAAGPGRAGRLDDGRGGDPERRQRPAGHAAAARAQGPDPPPAVRASRPAAAARRRGPRGRRGRGRDRVAPPLAPGGGRPHSSSTGT